MQKFSKLALASNLVFCGIAVAAVMGAMVIVPAGERMVVFNAFHGVEPRVLSEGTHMLVPFVQTTIPYDVRTQTYTMSATVDEGDKHGDDSVSVLTADGQTVKVDMSVRYHVVPENVWKLHESVGPTYLDKIIRPEARTVIRNVISGYTVTEVYSVKRGQIQKEIEQQMNEALKPYSIALDECLVRSVQFSPAFSEAIEKKQVALQEAERMRYVLQREEAEKQRKIIEATGEAEAIRRRAQALRENPLLVQYEYVQKLSPNVRAIIADQKTLVNIGSLLTENGK